MEPGFTSDSMYAFAQAVWGSPEAVLKRDHHLGLYYIDMAMFPLAFEFLLGAPATEHKKILVRKEYETALNELETNEVYHEGAYVTGQPGIGKTLFLAYLLVMCLGKRRPVAWQLHGRQYLVLRDTVTRHSLNETKPLDENRPLWALSDSALVRSPGAIFYGLSDVRTIQAAFPKEDRWKEWSKQAQAECYVMDIWSENEIVDLAKLLHLDVARMTALAKSWGGSPRQLLGFLNTKDDKIEEEYREAAVPAVRKCRWALSAAVQKNLIEEDLSNFYFCRPRRTEFRINRKAMSADVPTPTLRRFLGEALQNQDNAAKLDFFRALNQFNETRGAGGYIFESWFHIYISAAQSIQCHWVQGLSDVTLLTGTSTLIPSTWAAVKVAQPPCYWVAPKDTPGIDSALILDKEIHVFQVTINSTHKAPIDGLKKLRDHLPVALKEFGLRVVFIGYKDKAIEAVARAGVGNIPFPMGQAAVIGWSEVNPVMDGASYREIREESDFGDVSMEDAME